MSHQISEPVMRLKGDCLGEDGFLVANHSTRHYEKGKWYRHDEYFPFSSGRYVVVTDNGNWMEASYHSRDKVWSEPCRPFDVLSKKVVFCMMPDIPKI